MCVQPLAPPLPGRRGVAGLPGLVITEDSRVLHGGSPWPGGRGAVIAEDRRVRGGRLPCAGGFACRSRKSFVWLADDCRVTET